MIDSYSSKDEYRSADIFVAENNRDRSDIPLSLKITDLSDWIA